MAFSTWLGSSGVATIYEADKELDSLVARELRDLRYMLKEIDDRTHNNVYGKWKVITTVTHPDGTVVETAQRVIRKLK